MHISCIFCALQNIDLYKIVTNFEKFLPIKLYEIFGIRYYQNNDHKSY